MASSKESQSSINTDVARLATETLPLTPSGPAYALEGDPPIEASDAQVIPAQEDTHQS